MDRRYYGVDAIWDLREGNMDRSRQKNMEIHYSSRPSFRRWHMMTMMMKLLFPSLNKIKSISKQSKNIYSDGQLEQSILAWC